MTKDTKLMLKKILIKLVSLVVVVSAFSLESHRVTFWKSNIHTCFSAEE